MPTINKPLLRLAAAISAVLASRRGQEPLIDLPAGYWQRSVELVRQIRRAQLRGWHLAAGELRTDLRYTVTSVQSELAALVARLPISTMPERVATANDIYRDLVALSNEFEAVDYDRRGRWLSVSTEPIQLAGIYLGPFEIRLDWGRPLSADGPNYRVIAQEPHPAESRDNVTHPHVLDEVLCEGHGRQAIRQALAQGRLLDFFTLVAGVLRNYNPESPFVELALWYGQGCSDCGAVVSDDERYVCEPCGETICEGCETMCSGCEISCCSGCTTACAACEDIYCRGCLRRCDGCSGSVCSGCLDDHERCPTCHEEQSTEEIRPTDGAALQPHGLGQALVPA